MRKQTSNNALQTILFRNTHRVPSIQGLGDRGAGFYSFPAVATVFSLWSAQTASVVHIAS
jgi:hypothetical protein